MKAEELKKCIANKMVSDTQKEMERQEKYRVQLEKYKAAADAVLPLVREMIDNANMLGQAGIGLCTALACSCATNSSELRKYAWGTDGVNHLFGFYCADHMHMFHQFTEMGREMGGACGNRHIHTDGHSWWVMECGTRKPMCLDDYKKLFKKDENGLMVCIVKDKYNKWNEFLQSILS